MNIEETLKNLNRFPLVEDFKKEVEDSMKDVLQLGEEVKGLCDYRQLPISPSMIQPNETPVILHPEVTDKYQFFIRSLNYGFDSVNTPFALLGKRLHDGQQDMIHIQKFISCRDYEAPVSFKRAEIDYATLLDALANQQYDVFVLGRTHARYTEEDLRKSPIYELGSSYIEKYNIREPEFNIPLEELNEFSVIANVSDDQGYGKEIYQMTIMPSGEVSLIGISDDEYHKLENIEAITGNDLKKIPVQSFDSKFSSGKNIVKK